MHYLSGKWCTRWSLELSSCQSDFVVASVTAVLLEPQPRAEDVAKKG